MVIDATRAEDEYLAAYGGSEERSRESWKTRNTLERLGRLTFIPFTTNGKLGLNRAERTYDAWSALANSLNSALFKSDTAQNDIPLWIQ